MRFTFNRKEFLTALTACGNAVEKKTTIPILNNVLLELGPTNWLEITGTDLEIAVRRMVPVSNRSSEERFCITMPLAIVSKFLTSSKVDTVTFDSPACDLVDCTLCDGTGGGTFKHGGEDAIGPKPKCLRCDGTGKHLGQPVINLIAGATFQVEGMSAENFPDIPAIGTPEFPVIRLLDITADAWIDMSDKVSFAISQEESRFTLNGFLLEIKDKVRMVATDGHRLALIERGEMPEGTTPERALVPKRSAGIIKKVLGKSKDTVTILLTKEVDDKGELTGKNGNYLVFISGATVIITRIMTGNFPDWERVVPRRQPNPARATAKLLVQGIDAVKHCADDRSGAIRMKFNCEAVSLVAEAVDRGKAQIDVPCRTAIASGVEVVFNHKYMLDFLKAIDDVDIVAIHCHGEPEGVKVDDYGVPINEDTEEKAEERRRSRAAKGAWLFQSTADAGFSCVIMPMRI